MPNCLPQTACHQARLLSGCGSGIWWPLPAVWRRFRLLWLQSAAAVAWQDTGEVIRCCPCWSSVPVWRVFGKDSTDYPLSSPTQSPSLHGYGYPFFLKMWLTKSSYAVWANIEFGITTWTHTIHSFFLLFSSFFCIVTIGCTVACVCNFSSCLRMCLSGLVHVNGMFALVLVVLILFRA